jgi:hypothetical protein
MRSGLGRHDPARQGSGCGPLKKPDMLTCVERGRIDSFSTAQYGETLVVGKSLARVVDNPCAVFASAYPVIRIDVN